MDIRRIAEIHDNLTSEISNLALLLKHISDNQSVDYISVQPAPKGMTVGIGGHAAERGGEILLAWAEARLKELRGFQAGLIVLSESELYARAEKLGL